MPECNFEGFKHFISVNVSNIQKIIYHQIGLELLLDKHDVVALPDFFTKNKNQSYSINVERIGLVIDYLKSLEADEKVVWLGPRFSPWLNANKMLKNALSCRITTPEIDIFENMKIYSELDQTLARQVREHKSLTYASTIDAIGFEPSNDLYTCNEVFWSDGNHWSIAGAKEFGRRIIKSLLDKEILKNSKLYD